jgi:hypothetical protein
VSRYENGAKAPVFDAVLMPPRSAHGNIVRLVTWQLGIVCPLYCAVPSRTFCPTLPQSYSDVWYGESYHELSKST